MPHPQSPYPQSFADLSGGLGTTRHPKDVFCAPRSLHPQSPLLSVSPAQSVEVPPMASAAQDSAFSSHHRAPSTVMGFDEPEPMQWAGPSNFPINRMGQNVAGYNMPAPYTPDSGAFYHYAQDGMSYNDNYSDNYNHTYSTQYPSPSCPRSYHGLDLTGLPNDMNMSGSYPPDAYQIEPQKHHDAMDLSDPEINTQLTQLSNDYEHHHYGSQIKAEAQGDYQSPYSDLTRASTPHDGLPRYPHDAETEDDIGIDKDQPYAQLIFEALRQAPGRTMILRDIYDWFKKYTDKASASETKGWQNSIRHNLSMNGAFEKVDQPSEDARKGFMWRLTDEAFREGVKSTTRYRSKQPNKRGHRTPHPLPQRQASGAKGGQAARRSARMKRSQRMQDAYPNDAYISRSVPSAFDPTFNTPDPSMPYPPSPYFGSEVGAFNYTPDTDTFATHLFAPTSSYTGSPMSQGMPITDTAFMLDQSPTESLFTDSPSPSADEPRTPVSQRGWGEEVGLGAPCGFDDVMYREYAA